MRESPVVFFSECTRMAGILRSPDTVSEPGPAIVQDPGWLGLADAGLYVRYHEALTAAGMTVLVFDYRGFGKSGGKRGMLSPAAQVQDLINAVSYIATLETVDPEAIGVFGSGGTGAGNAIMLGAVDSRVACIVSQLPIADGEDWLR